MSIASSRRRFFEGLRALELFAGRHDLIRLYASRIHQLPHAEESILFFHGDGGNGKTLLLRFLKTASSKRLSPPARSTWGPKSSQNGRVSGDFRIRRPPPLALLEQSAADQLGRSNRLYPSCIWLIYQPSRFEGPKVNGCWLELTPDVQAGLLAQTQDIGLSLEAYVDLVLRERSGVAARPPLTRPQIAGQRIRELRKGLTLGGISKELIEEGRE